jgi:hypothetical protein
MIVRSAILKLGRAQLAVFLVDPDLTYPVPGAAYIAQVRHLHPTLPIMLIAPRVQGFSRTYAVFELKSVHEINTDTVEWIEQELAPFEEELPF